MVSSVAVVQLSRPRTSCLAVASGGVSPHTRDVGAGEVMVQPLLEGVGWAVVLTSCGAGIHRADR